MNEKCHLYIRYAPVTVGCHLLVKILSLVMLTKEASLFL
jgi:hypothetical protein